MKKKRFSIEETNKVNVNNEEQMIMRSEDEIKAAEEYFFDILWWNRHEITSEKMKEQWDPDILKEALENAERVKREIPEEQRVAKDDFEWGMINGKISALRWVLGYDWDMLDS